MAFGVAESWITNIRRRVSRRIEIFKTQFNLQPVPVPNVQPAKFIPSVISIYPPNTHEMQEMVFILMNSKPPNEKELSAELFRTLRRLLFYPIIDLLAKIWSLESISISRWKSIIFRSSKEN
ncbi:hypothetical protein X801_01151 [Opisthorchis viverrini]|uniref:Uncharacterized protein n=1 Tax=Opisthorchis viverrini TaxID=6198 RepID=A0A1S8X8E7_OPIVI|nr:hypothetical protein X801_01151 [Opisthorchis viverrini]